VQLKESDDSGMPPVIVGSGDVDPGTFVIGEDDGDAEEEGFEYVHDVEMTPGTSNASPMPEHALRSIGLGSPRSSDVWDHGGPPVFSGPVE